MGCGGGSSGVVMVGRVLHSLHDHKCKVLIAIGAGCNDDFVFVGSQPHGQQVAAASGGQPVGNKMAGPFKNGGALPTWAPAA